MFIRRQGRRDDDERTAGKPAGGVGGQDDLMLGQCVPRTECAFNNRTYFHLTVRHLHLFLCCACPHPHLTHRAARSEVWVGAATMMRQFGRVGLCSVPTRAAPLIMAPMRSSLELKCPTTTTAVDSIDSRGAVLGGLQLALLFGGRCMQEHPLRSLKQRHPHHRRIGGQTRPPIWQ